MSTQVKFRKGTSAEHSTFTGAAGEMTVDTTKNTLVVHDGSTAGGFPAGLDSTLTTLESNISNVEGDIPPLETRAALHDNMIINGDLRLWQRGTSFTSVPDSTYMADRWKYTKNGTGVIDAIKAGSAPSNLELEVTTADTSLATNDYYLLSQEIEGYNIASTLFGTAAARTLALSFYVKSSLAGTYCITLRNGTYNRTYRAEYTINTADTWERKEIIIPGDTTGTWGYVNEKGIGLFFVLAIGSQFEGDNETWEGSQIFKTSNQVNFMATVGNKFAVSQIKLEIGEKVTEYQYRPYGTERALCQRYYEKGRVVFSADVGAAISYVAAAELKQQKRAHPTMTWTASGQSSLFTSVAPTNHTSNGNFAMAFKTATGSGQGQYWGGDYTADAEL